MRLIFDVLSFESVVSASFGSFGVLPGVAVVTLERVLLCVPRRGGSGGPACVCDCLDVDIVDERDVFVPVRFGRGGGFSSV